MSSTGDIILFKALVNLFEKVSHAHGITEKKVILKQFITDWRTLHSEVHASNPSAGKEDTFFSILRLILPSLDRDRPNIAMKEKRLAKNLLKSAGMSEKSGDAKRLYNFRITKGGGDFGTLVFSIFRERCPPDEKTPLTINQLNSILDELADADQAKCDEVLLMLLAKLPALSLKWLVRIILKDLRLGVSVNVVLDCVHPDSREIYDHTMNLKLAASPIADSASITLFSPFRPMLAERIDEQNISKLFQNGLAYYFVETKLDGERVLVHFKDGEFKFLSRAGLDFSDSYKTISEKLSAMLSAFVHSVILDGEMMVYDSEHDCYVDKGSSPVDVKSIGSDSRYHAAYYVFDILFLNNVELINKPLTERRKALGSVIERAEPGYVTLMYEEKLAKSPKDVIKALNDSIANKHEGIVLKDPTSVYRPHGRQKAGWLKLKHDYVSSLSDDLDLLVVGGSFGVGRNSGSFSHFLCAIRSGVEEFSSFANISSGFSNSDLTKLNDRFSHSNTVTGVPQWLENGSVGKMDMYFATPQDATIIQVRAGQIIPSDKTVTGYTLRFPRFVCFREGDKLWSETTHIDEIKSFLSSFGSKRMHMEDVEPTPKRSKPISSRVASKYLGPFQSDVKVELNIFDGKEICVLSSDWRTKKELEKRVIAFGGVIVQNPGKNTWVVAVSKKITVHVKNVIKSGLYDVVSSSWLDRCIEAKQLLPLFDQEIIYQQSSSLFSLDQVRELVANSEAFDGDYRAAVVELGLDDAIFRSCNIYFDSDLFGPLALARVEARLNGAILVELSDPYITHIICMPTSSNNLIKFQNLNYRRSKKIHIVNENWIWDSISSGRIINETSYRL